ncbi:MAG: VOC family protein [Caulobacteraceae bacterium]
MRLPLTVSAGLAGVLLAGWAGAQDRPAALLPRAAIGAASIGAVDVERDARFYEDVFGFKEIRRIDARPQFLEIVLKPGADAAAARAAPGAALILISHPAGAATDRPGLQGWARAHLLLVVPEMAPVLASVRAHGGSRSPSHRASPRDRSRPKAKPIQEAKGLMSTP